MCAVTVFNHVTLDGVIQAPGRPDEDPRGGFTHGGWAAAAAGDPAIGQIAAQGMSQSGALLLGRWTYESFHAFWPRQPDNPFSARLESSLKYVASRTLSEPLPWANSVLLGGDAADSVAEIDADVTVLGSGELIASLAARGLIDRYILMIHPLVLGAGRRLFAGGVLARLTLVDSVVGDSGVIIATYEPAERSA